MTLAGLLAILALVAFFGTTLWHTIQDIRRERRHTPHYFRNATLGCLFFTIIGGIFCLVCYGIYLLTDNVVLF